MKIAMGNDHSAVEMKRKSGNIWKQRAMKWLILERMKRQAATIRFTGKR